MIRTSRICPNPDAAAERSACGNDTSRFCAACAHTMTPNAALKNSSSLMRSQKTSGLRVRMSGLSRRPCMGDATGPTSGSGSPVGTGVVCSANGISLGRTRSAYGARSGPPDLVSAASMRAATAHGDATRPRSGGGRVADQASAGASSGSGTKSTPASLRCGSLMGAGAAVSGS